MYSVLPAQSILRDNRAGSSLPVHTLYLTQTTIVCLAVSLHFCAKSGAYFHHFALHQYIIWHYHTVTLTFGMKALTSFWEDKESQAEANSIIWENSLYTKLSQRMDMVNIEHSLKQCWDIRAGRYTTIRSRTTIKHAGQESILVPSGMGSNRCSGQKYPWSPPGF